MTRVVAFPLEAGGQVLIEVAGEDTAPTLRGLRATEPDIAGPRPSASPPSPPPPGSPRPVAMQGPRAADRGAAVAGGAVSAVAGSFEAALATLRPAAETLAGTFLALVSQPGAVEVEFGLKFTGQAGAFIASASTEAQFRVKLTWTRPAAG